MQQFLIERQQLSRIHRVHAILFVNRLPEHDAPAIVSLLEEIVKAPGADHVAENIVHQRALIDGHLGLRDGSRTFDVHRECALKVQNVDAAIEAFLADANEFVGRSLEPGGHHVAVVMPHGAKPFPIARHRATAPSCRLRFESPKLPSIHHLPCPDIVSACAFPQVYPEDMERAIGVSESKAGWITKGLYRALQKRIGKVPVSKTLAAHHTPTLLATTWMDAVCASRAQFRPYSRNWCS